MTPALFGCEIDGFLQVGEPVVIVRFGQSEFGIGGGDKLWASQTTTAIEPGRVIIGIGGDGTPPCPGDSGGPVFVQVTDGSWRVFGTVLGGTTGIPCNSAADCQRIDPVVPNLETRRGVDIIHCCDGQTGEWEAGPDCGGFFAGDHEGSGTWPDWCAGTDVAGWSSSCGGAFDDGAGDGDGDGANDQFGSGDGTGAADDDGVCACQSRNRSIAISSPWRMMPEGVGLRRRRLAA